MGDRRENLDKRNAKTLRIGNRECSVNLTIAANALSIKIINSIQFKKTLFEEKTVVHINLLISMYLKKEQITRATYYLHTSWGCTAPFRQCKTVPPHQFCPVIPHVFLAFSLKQKERDISLGYTKVSIIGYFIAHGKK